MRDIPPPAPPPMLSAVPPQAAMPSTVILPRLLQPPRLRSGGIGVVETPLTVDEEATRLFVRNALENVVELRPSREKLPMREETNSIEQFE
ncbi:hypothetical protein TELCIR_03826 [Teladorsagia circumcincta]|uniref:Uncharacterized protein n=1 Tax=Teladorsagia circumcincta TaxID=45464 RepID=A0A2G9UV98_TELCI|nr:hypothetical protein TELCIR_03826 [Teladorsagia circumcincta]